jgi:ribosomal-protein-alanine N-acetyltransferase
VLVATPRLRLEPLARVHAAELLAPLAAPALSAWFGDDAFTTAGELADAWDALARRLREKHGLARLGWVARAGAYGPCVGKLDVQIDAARVATNVGWMFFPGHWGRGYATEAVRALAEHLERGGVAEQRAFVTVGNLDSLRVAARCGFAQTGYQRASERFRGFDYDEIALVRRRAS